MPMSKFPIGEDSDGKPVNVVWGTALNWAYGYIETRGQKVREYYRAHGKGNAYYAVARELTNSSTSSGQEFKYWYVSMHIDGKTENLPTECMNAFEGQEICQIFESERDTRARELSKERARVEDKRDD